jgi:murein DD-endopeptidase MepM/ murein hydrolase activator NlpD
VLALCAWHPAATSAQDSLPPPTAAHPDSTAAARPEPDTLAGLKVELAPLSLVEGTIDWLQALPDSAVTITGGLLAGEPLHVTEQRSGGYRTLAGIPVDVGDSLPVSLFLTRGDRTDTVVRFIRITRAGYPREQIAVAPAFVRPDSAAARRIQRELARSREVSRKAQETPRLWRGGFRLPRPSRITSRFGSARVYNGEVKSRHLGTDFAGAVGAPVRAAGRGVVAMVGDFYLAGKAVYLNHGGGLVTAYFHLSRVDVKEGQTVARGQRIGAVGRTGRVTGPHLHWVARYGAVSADPMSLLALTPHSTGRHGRSTP